MAGSSRAVGVGASREVRRWRRRAATARRVLRESGLRGLVFLLVQRARPVLRVHPEWFAVFENGTADLGAAHPVPADVRIAKAVEPGGLLLLGHPEDLIRRRLARGDLCVAAHDGAGLAGFAWYRFDGVYDEQGMLFTVRGDVAWGYDLMVAERRRREGLSTALVAVANDLLRARGITRVVAAIDAVNAPALAGARSRGAREIGRVVMVRAGRLSVRREAWEGSAVRWSVCRGDRAARWPSGG